MIGSCDNCGKDGVPVFNGESCGCETTQCHVCNGDVLDPYGELEDELAEIMKDFGGSAEEQIERKCDWIIRELDELMAMAANSETVDLVEGQKIAVGQIMSRAQLVAAFLMTRKPHLTVVSNNG